MGRREGAGKKDNVKKEALWFFSYPEKSPGKISRNEAMARSIVEREIRIASSLSGLGFLNKGCGNINPFVQELSFFTHI